MSRGYRSGPYMAIRPGGRGDITASHVVWEVPTGAPYISSLVYDDGILYMASDVGVLTAIDAATGEAHLAAARRRHLLGVAGRGRRQDLLRQRERRDDRPEGGTAPEVVARNDLGERAVASPAISNGQIFIRTDDHVFCIGG